MHALALLCINQQTKFEVPSFTISKDMIKLIDCRDVTSPYLAHSYNTAQLNELPHFWNTFNAKKLIETIGYDYTTLNKNGSAKELSETIDKTKWTRLYCPQPST